jgi:hypothetical protein
VLETIFIILLMTEKLGPPFQIYPRQAIILYTSVFSWSVPEPIEGDICDAVARAHNRKKNSKNRTIIIFFSGSQRCIP